MRNVGSSITSAPCSSRSAANSEACARARVTTIRRPKSGRRSNQLSFSRSATTRPITTITGGSSPADCAAAASVFTVAVTTL